MQDDGETIRMVCETCGHVGLQESEGYYYCQDCGAQADGMLDTGVADEDFIDKGGDGGAVYRSRHTRHLTPKPTPGGTVDKSSLIWLTQEEEDLAANNNNTNYSNIKREPEYFSGNYCEDGVGPMEPEDFGSGPKGKLGYEDYYNEVRIRYVMGMQWMVELQCEALVRDFRVTPLICGVASTVWLRFLAGTEVFKDDWADRIIMESEPPSHDESHDPDSQSGLHTGSVNEPDYDDVLKETRVRYPNEPYNSSGHRAVMIWFRYLRKAIPLSCSLAIVFLACHVAREAVLPTDILKWAIEGKLPYFAAHVEIGKRFERPSPACPISSSLMFRPSQAVPIQKLESMAATIAESIGLHLPPVNFYEIASRYLKQLSLPVEKILPHACRIYEWSMPPDLWLSTNESRLPTRVCILSGLIVAIRILYNLNGFGLWESSLSTHIGKFGSPCCSDMSLDTENVPCSPPQKLDDSGEKSAANASHIQNSGLDAKELLDNLDKKYHELSDAYDFAKDLSSYLQYCEDVMFAGTGASHMYHEEEELIEKLWEFYQNEKYSESAEDPGSQDNTVLNDKRSRADDAYVQSQLGNKRIKKSCCGSISADSSTCQIEEESYVSPCPDTSNYHADIGTHEELDNDQVSHNSSGERNSEDCEEAWAWTHRDEVSLALRRLKLNMEENRFLYIPPRVNVKRYDYLHYARKKDVGVLKYAAHADYYILVRACARVAQVDTRIMHIGVLSLERRLAWLEKRIDHCLHVAPPSITCDFCAGVPDHPGDDLAALSQLKL